jgi:membrane fusion protein, multidrug efflux system
MNRAKGSALGHTGSIREFRLYRFGTGWLVAVAAMSLAACESGDPKSGPGGRDRKPPTVIVQPVGTFQFSDRIEAVGTAYARESTTLTSTVTERITRLRFQDGESVRKGDVIAELSRSAETADLASADARAKQAQQQFNRINELARRGFATRSQVEAQTAALDAARAQSGLVDAQIGDRIIRAPFAGVVSLRRISEGATVGAGTEIATISDVSTIKLDFSLPELFLSAVQLGQSIEARTAAYPDDVFRGKVEGIDPVVDPITRSVTVRAVLPNDNRRLRPGMLLTVRVIANPRERLAVPELALVAERDRIYVFKIDGESVALKSPVETGTRQDGMVEIGRGLSAGDRIVAEGTVKVRDGGKVRASGTREPTERSGRR